MGFAIVYFAVLGVLAIIIGLLQWAGFEVRSHTRRPLIRGGKPLKRGSHDEVG